MVMALGRVRLGRARFGLARRGMVRQGGAWLGWARHGEGGPDLRVRPSNLRG